MYNIHKKILFYLITIFLFLCVSIIFSLYLFEIIVVLKKNFFSENKLYENILLPLKNKEKIALKGLSKFEILNHLKQKNQKVYSSIYPGILYKNKLFISENNILPLSGISYVKTLLCNTNQNIYPVFYFSDSHGFRNNLKDYKNLSLVLTGDSFTHGYCEDYDLNYFLNKKGVKTLNLGIQGNGPLSALGTMREYNVASKSLIYVYHENDLIDLEFEKKTFLINYLDPNFLQNLKNKRKDIDNILIDYHSKLFNINEKRKKNFLNFLNRDIKDIIFLYNIRRLYKIYFNNEAVKISNNNYDFKLFEKILLLMDKEAKKKNQKFYIVFTPSKFKYHFKKEIYPERTKILKLAKKLNINVIDFDDIISKENDYRKLFNLSDSHYNQLGYLKLSNLIIEHLNFKYKD